MKRWWVGAPALAVACNAPITWVGEYHAVQSAEAGSAASDAGRVVSGAAPGHEASVPIVTEAGAAGFYLEAEDGVLSAGFTIASDVKASGSEYIVSAAGTPSNDVPGAARATYRVTLAESGTYVIWGRIHSPDVARNAFWVRVDEDRWYVWRLSTGEDWYWGTFHDNVQYGIPISFLLGAGAHTVEIANYVDGVSLDRLYVTTGKERPVGDDTLCRPPDSIRLGGGCIDSCGSQGGTTCGAEVCAGRVAIPAYDCAICCVGG